jgi:hypothetical protein
MESLMQNVVHTIVQETRADMACIHFLGTDDESRRQNQAQAAGFEGAWMTSTWNCCSRSLMRHGPGRICCAEEPQFEDLLPHLSSLMILPFVIEKEVMGTLTVAIHHPAPALTDLGITRLSTFAEFASLTLDNHFKYAELIKKGEAEYQALQSQVQPHFIYNVLNGFIGLNRMGEKKGLEERPSSN